MGKFATRFGSFGTVLGLAFSLALGGCASPGKKTAAVRSVLLDGGLAASQLDTTGMGEAQPLVPNTSSANRAKNRRVELKVVPTRT